MGNNRELIEGMVDDILRYARKAERGAHIARTAGMGFGAATSVTGAGIGAVKGGVQTIRDLSTWWKGKRVKQEQFMAHVLASLTVHEFLTTFLVDSRTKQEIVRAVPPSELTRQSRMSMVSVWQHLSRRAQKDVLGAIGAEHFAEMPNMGRVSNDKSININLSDR